MDEHEYRLDDYFQYFMPFIVTALLPTAISSQWRKIDSHRLTRDEQTWLSTTYVQIYAFLQVRCVCHMRRCLSIFACPCPPASGIVECNGRYSVACMEFA